jgi:hypothetical protein
VDGRRFEPCWAHQMIVPFRKRGQRTEHLYSYSSSGKTRDKPGCNPVSSQKSTTLSKSAKCSVLCNHRKVIRACGVKAPRVKHRTMTRLQSPFRKRRQFIPTWRILARALNRIDTGRGFRGWRTVVRIHNVKVVRWVWIVNADMVQTFPGVKYRSGRKDNAVYLLV